MAAGCSAVGIGRPSACIGRVISGEIESAGSHSPVDVIDGPPPPMLSAGEQADWDRARDQHVALAKAAKMKPLKKALLTDACRGQINVRWAERYGKIPDGPSVGQPFRLLEFQRDIIREVYADPGYWQAVDAVLKKRRAA